MKKGTREDLSGLRSGRLLIVKFSHYEPKNRTNYWECMCDCGTIKVLPGTVVKKGKIVSCGCYLNDNIKLWNRTHGRSYTREYKSWTMMKARCSNPSNKDYHHYGGRGIRFCEGWDKFVNFFNDMGPCPEGMTLDRRDFNGNYEPNNCRWATWEQQHNNTRSNKFITYHNLTLTPTQWEKKLGVRPYQLTNYLRKGGTNGKGGGRTFESFLELKGLKI